MNELKDKRLLILGGSRISCEIVRQAQKMGIYTMVTDWYPLEKSPAKQIADKYFMTSTTDISAMVKLIKDQQIDGVITGFTDSVLPYYGEICKAAGLPCYGTKEQFEILTNKNKYKQLCREFGVPVIEEYQIDEKDLETDEINKIKYPILVKPADGSGAKGVSICKNRSQLIKGYQKALDHSESREILIERYVEGKEVTVFYTLQDGEVYLSGMGNRHVKHNQSGVIPLPVAYTFPSIYLNDYRERVEPRVKEMFNSLGMKNGMAFMQCLVEGGECYVYDIGYRLTGSLEYKLLNEICGYDPLEMMIKFALTGQMGNSSIREKSNPVWNKYGCNVSFLIKPGMIEKVYGIDAIKEIPGVIDAVLAHVEGEELPKSARGTLRQIVLRVFATSESQDVLKNILNQVYSTLKVISVEGENMLLEGFDTEDLKGELV